ncbi:MAG: division/cell wall cluster transcriptional repressor MraZ [Patescibacteria group bacterium]
MLIGEYQHTIDAKKRLAIPSKFRRELGERAVVTRGVDACLFVFPLQHWEVLAERIANLPVTQGDSRSFARLMLSGATEVEFDSLGRVLIPDHLKSYAGLNRSVVVAGLYKRLEIWDAAAWERTKQELEKNSDRIAEKLGELGGI